MKKIFFLLISSLLLLGACKKIKTEQKYPDIKDDKDTELQGWTIARIEQIAKQKADSIRIVDSLSKITGQVDPNSLLTKKNLLIAYVEVNNRAFKNVTCYLGDDNKPVIDLAWIFAPNINIDAATGKAKITYNRQVQALIDNGWHKYVQSKGVKVGMTILGNHDDAGFRNFRNLEEATAFAQHVAIEVRRLGLDAIDFDDEYSNSPSWANNQSFVMVVSEVKRLLPDKFVHCYIYGGAGSSVYNNKRMGDVADAGSSAYYPQIPSIGSAGFPVGKLIASAKPFSPSYSGFGNAEATCKDLMTQGYRGVMLFDFNSFVTNSVDLLRPYVKGLKNQDVKEITGCPIRTESDDVNVTNKP